MATIADITEKIDITEQASSTEKAINAEKVGVTEEFEECLEDDAVLVEDAVLVQRERIARISSVARTIGYALYLVSLLVVGISLLADARFSWVYSFATIALIAGTVLLAPAIIVGYMVKAANRADRESSW